VKHASSSDSGKPTLTRLSGKIGHSQGFRKQICAFWSPGVSLQNLQNLPRDFQTWGIIPKGQPNFIVSSHLRSLLHLPLHSPSKHSSLNIIAWIAVMYFTLSVSLRLGSYHNAISFWLKCSQPPRLEKYHCSIIKCGFLRSPIPWLIFRPCTGVFIVENNQ
jgi:hypothetical protein